MTSFHLDRGRLLKSLVLAAGMMVLMFRPWSGQSEPRDLWGLLGAVLVSWIVFYRAWPAYAYVDLRLALPRMIPGLLIGLGIAVLAPRFIGGATGWDEGTVAFLFVGVCFAVVAATIVVELLRRRLAQSQPGAARR